MTTYHIPSEANSRSPSQADPPRLSWHMAIHHRVNNSPTYVPTFYHMNPNMPSNPYDPFLSAFAKSRIATTSFVMSVCPSAWNYSDPTGRTVMKSDMSNFRKSIEKIQVSLKYDKNNGCFTWPMYKYVTSLSSSQNEKCFRQTLKMKWKHTLRVQ